MSLDTSAANAKLAAFKRKKKFSATEWKKRGLLPSSTAICAALETMLNALAGRLATATTETEPSVVADRLLKQALREIDRDEYDTEEAEFVCTLIATLAKIFELKFGPDLNSWLYGEALAEAMLKQAEQEKPKAIQTLSQLCTKCGTALQSAIDALRPDNPSESWFSIECASCSELNFLVLPAGIGSMRPIGYKLVTQYWRNQFNRESAEAAFQKAHTKRAKNGSTSKRHSAA